MIVGVIRPDGGTIYLDDHDITSLPCMRAQLGVGYFLRTFDFRKLTVVDNRAVLELRRD